MCVAIVSFVTMGCKKNPDDPIHTGNMQTVALQGKVMDTSGNPLSGVKVTTGTASAISGNNGKFSFKEAEVINKRAVIKFEKSGYFTLTRSGVKQNEMFIEAVMHPKGNSDISIQTTFDTKDETTLKVPAGMEVKFPASSIMRADGSAYSGTVRADMLYLDPNNENFTGMMPGGDLAAIRTDNSEVMLISWGMTDVVLTDESGKPLQIKNGSEAETTFPIPAGMQSNPPATIPLWSFNDAKGIWIEEGVATLQGNVYVGTTTHFSWVNLDEPARRVTIKGEVKDCEDKAVPYVKVTADQTSAYTNSKGEFTVIVPEQTAVTVKVTANGGSDSHHVPGQSGESTYSGIKLIVPCDEEEDDDDEPGTLTHVEKGAIKYDMQGSITAVTFANKGWRYRWDFFENETSKISEVAYIINHYNKTFWVGSNYDGEVNWMDLPFEYAASPYTISIDEEVMKPYQQPGNINIAGKSCKVFIYNYMGMVLKYASWNGLIMMMEQDGEMIMIAVAATIDVPEAAFTKTFNVSWLP
jgi:hypothetical protein